MNIFKKKILSTVFAITLTGTAQTSMAASTANATIDWSSLNVQLTDTTGGDNPLGFSWLSTSPYYSNTAFSQTGSVIQDQSVETNPSSTHAITAGAQSHGVINNNLMQAASQSHPSVAESYTYADAYNYAEFEITGQGYVEISLNWSTSVSGEEGNYFDYSTAQAYLLGQPQDDNINYFFDYIDSNYDGTINHNGTFTLRFDNDGNDTFSGFIQSEAYTEAYGSVAPVPVPAAIWLLGSGLVGLMGFSRRKQTFA
ncbi:MAG: VPLPA-CTERM sorting domain-containing protein [Methylococcales bacterium]